jgi:hypothetical protein
MSAGLLPEAFADLEKFSGWILPSEGARMQKRRDSTLDDLAALHEAMLPRLEAILSHLNTFPLDAMPEREERLLRLTYALAEVTPFVEQYRRTVLPELFDERRFVILHDQGARR